MEIECIKHIHVVQFSTNLFYEKSNLMSYEFKHIPAENNSQSSEIQQHCLDGSTVCKCPCFLPVLICVEVSYGEVLSQPYCTV